MLDLTSGLFVKACVFPGYTHDLQGTCDLHRQLVGKGDLILADRAFASITHFAVVAWHGLDAVMRVKEKGHKGGKAKGRGLDKIPRYKGSVRLKIISDGSVEKRLPTKAPTTVDASIFGDLPASVVLRQVIFEMHCSGYRSQRVCLWTTLDDALLHDAESLAALYMRRWQIEVAFRDLKRTMKAAVLKGRSPEVVLKEFWGHLMAYNLVRMVAVEAAGKRDVDSSGVSFICAWRWMRRMTTPPEDASDGPTGIVVNPVNPRHQDVRRTKRPPPNYSRLSKPREEYFLQPSDAASLAEVA